MPLVQIIGIAFCVPVALFLMIWCYQTVPTGSETYRNGYIQVMDVKRKRDAGRRPFLILAGLLWFFAAIIIWNWTDIDAIANYIWALRLLFITLAVISFSMMASFSDKEPMDWIGEDDESTLEVEDKQAKMLNQMQSQRTLGMGSRNYQQMRSRQYREYRRQHPDYGEE